MTSIINALINALLTLVKNAIKLLIYIVPPILIILIVFIFILLFWYVYYSKIKKMKSIKRNNNIYFTLEKINYVIERPYERIYEPSILSRIFFKFPKQLVYDYITQDPNAFGHFGIHMFCGKQGSGKTVTAVYLMRKWLREYPRAKVYANIDLDFKDGDIRHWRDMIRHSNGIYGCINFIDEIQTWFSNAESKDIPPSLLGEISQQRKQKKAIIGTAQVFSKVAKPLREQTHFVYLPKTFFNCFTFVRMAESEDYNPETNKFKKYKGMFFFIHDQELRNCYDTYEKVQRYADTKFSSSSYYGTDSTDGGGVHK